MKKPNIVMFLGDQLRSDAIGINGCRAAKTPNIDRLAKEGVSYRNAYCQNPVCVPSRCSFLTGMYPHTKGHRTMHYLLEEDDKTILESLKENGYAVYWLGRNDIYSSKKPELIKRCCHEYFEGKRYVSFTELEHHETIPREEVMADPYYYSFYQGEISSQEAHGELDWLCINRALEILDKIDDEQPFCLYISLQFPHPPYRCEEPWFSSIDRSFIEERRPDVETLKGKPSMLHGIREKQNLGSWTEAMYRELKAVYYAMVSRLDSHFGMIVDKLKEKNLYDDTNIIFFSDHGDYTGDYGIVEKAQNTFENPVSNVPLIIKPSSGFPVLPRVSGVLAELVDLPATIAQMAGIRLNYVQFGKSLLHTLDREEEHKKAVFCEGGRVHGEDYAKEGGHNYLSEYWPRLCTQQSEGPEHTKAVMVRMGNYKYIKRLYESDEFYNLSSDPAELCNEIDNSKYGDIINQCRLEIMEHLIKTGDYIPRRKDIR